jgi:hypothetical protein
MKVYYRFSDGGFNKLKPEYVTKKNCLLNFLKHFHLADVEITIIADKVSEETVKWLEEDITSRVGINYIRTNFGYGSQAYIKVLEMATGLPDNEEIYFVEDDYIHREKSFQTLREGLEIADYVTLYDHPDKYLSRNQMGNPLVKDGGEDTKVFITRSTHWKITNSTPMTFAVKAKTLKQDKEIHLHFCQGTMTDSYRMFLQLREKGRKLISCLPAKATHGELQWLSPLVDWRKEIEL